MQWLYEAKEIGWCPPFLSCKTWILALMSADAISGKGESSTQPISFLSLLTFFTCSQK